MFHETENRLNEVTRQGPRAFRAVRRRGGLKLFSVDESAEIIPQLMPIVWPQTLNCSTDLSHGTAILISSVPAHHLLERPQSSKRGLTGPQRTAIIASPRVCL